jgi:hypothetical protein
MGKFGRLSYARTGQVSHAQVKMAVQAIECWQLLKKTRSGSSSAEKMLQVMQPLKAANNFTTAVIDFT